MIHAARPRRRWSRISFSLMPLIDVVFLLVLFFALAQGASHVRPEPVELPRSATGTAREEDPSAPVVTVRADGSVLLDGRPISAGALRAALEDRRDATPRIRADRQLAYARVREVLEGIGATGRTVTLGVEPGNGTGEAPP